MKKQATKFELDGVNILTKPLFLNDNLASVRNAILGKVKEKVNSSFIFLDQDGNNVDTNDENDLTLEDIIVGKIVKLKKCGGDTTQEPSINIYLNNKNICSINSNKDKKLSEIRKLIKAKINNNFIFLDSDNNEIEKDDEKDLSVEDILNEEVIKLKSDGNCTNSPAATPFVETNKKEDNEKKKETKKPIDFSKYRIINQRDDLTIYKYSDLERISNHKLVYQYFYDKFDVHDYQNAYVVLFCGKTGDGKSTAINAFFNIIKGIKLEDNYRFILITEPKKEGDQAVSQTDGVHLYYLRDYDDKPVIIIDSQGYGDTRGKEYDEMVNEAFEFVFSSVIDHLNAACFISKANTNRIDILTKYIFSSVTCLFSEDISENFLIIATFAAKDTIKDGPTFIKTIKTDASFLKIQNRLDDKWWFAFDSKSILDNETDRLTKYSFDQMNALYEEKVKKLWPKNIKKCADVLKTRNQLKIEVNLLSDTFQDLLQEQANLQEREKVINEITKKIDDMEKSIKNFEKESKNLNPQQLEQKMKKLNEELYQKLNNLNHETEIEYINSLEYDSLRTYNRCDRCERNCHSPCDCIGNLLGRCTKFPWTVFGDKRCDECNCLKEAHKIDYYHWIKKSRNKPKNNEDQINNAKKENEAQQNKINEEIRQKQNKISSLENQIMELNKNKKQLLEEKNSNLKNKEDTEKNIEMIKNQITFIIIKLQRISEKINDIALNNNHSKTEDEYIDSLKDKMEEVGLNDVDQKNALNEMKEKNRIFREINGLNKEELLKLDDSQIAKRLSIIIPQNKKSKK